MVSLPLTIYRICSQETRTRNDRHPISTFCDPFAKELCQPVPERLPEAFVISRRRACRIPAPLRLVVAVLACFCDDALQADELCIRASVTQGCRHNPTAEPLADPDDGVLAARRDLLENLSSHEEAAELVAVVVDLVLELLEDIGRVAHGTPRRREVVVPDLLDGRLELLLDPATRRAGTASTAADLVSQRRDGVRHAPPADGRVAAGRVGARLPI